MYGGSDFGYPSASRLYCEDRGIGYSNADPHPGPLPSDAGRVPYLFGWTPSFRRKTSKMRPIFLWRSLVALEPRVGDSIDDQVFHSIFWAFCAGDGVQPKRYG